jgi:hypothetical protein
MLASACAPQEPTDPQATPQALTDEQCEKIASKVLEKLQGGQQQNENPEDPENHEDPEPENPEDPEEGE